jgi:hypothetical protein
MRPYLLEYLTANPLFGRVADKIVGVKRLADGDFGLTETVKPIRFTHNEQPAFQLYYFFFEEIGKIFSDAVQFPKSTQLILQNRNPRIPVRALLCAGTDRPNSHVRFLTVERGMIHLLTLKNP